MSRLPAFAGSVDEEASCPEKAVLDLTRRHAAQIRRSVPITAVVLPRIGHEQAQLRPVGSAEALRTLTPSTIVQMPHRSADVVRTVARLVREVPTYRLELGGDLRAAAYLVRGLAGEP